MKKKHIKILKVTSTAKPRRLPCLNELCSHWFCHWPLLLQRLRKLPAYTLTCNSILQSKEMLIVIRQRGKGNPCFHEFPFVICVVRLSIRDMRRPIYTKRFDQLGTFSRRFNFCIDMINVFLLKTTYYTIFTKLFMIVQLAATDQPEQLVNVVRRDIDGFSHAE